MTYLNFFWASASKHFHGAGLEQGADLTTYRRNYAYYTRRKEYNKAAMLRVFVAGGTWPQQRRFAANLVSSEKCPRCNLAVEDSFHVFYGCIKKQGDKREGSHRVGISFGAGCRLSSGLPRFMV